MAPSVFLFTISFFSTHVYLFICLSIRPSLSPSLSFNIYDKYILTFKLQSHRGQHIAVIDAQILYQLLLISHIAILPLHAPAHPL